MNAAQVIPFRFEAREVRTIVIDDQPWFCAADVCEVLGYANSRQAIQKNCRPEGVSVRDTLTRGGKQALTFIAEGNLYRLIIKSRKEEAQRFEAWVCDEVLPAIRKHGSYTDTHNKMGTLIGETIGTNGFNMLGALVKGKVAQLPTATQRRATAKIWSQTHAAFGVRSAADIPADQLDAARNFIAAYALEGEYLPKQDGIQLEPGPLRRYLVSFNHEGKQQVSAIPSDACVLSHRDLIKGMITPGEIMVSTEEMFEFAMSALTNLKGRSDYQAKQLHHLKSTR